MSEMIERVARNLLEHVQNRSVINRLIPGSGRSWDGFPKFVKDEYLTFARAAIKSMREPTQEMYDALSAKDKLWREINSTEVWQAFIDGALK